ncbi:MAG: hypothetical protein WBO09_06080 [Methylocystis silviterrae]|uniref:hypothetical protein n=1 Tax=Methylocystis silviterrae TaxID=2743612 RepID=UPI003C71CDA7
MADEPDQAPRHDIDPKLAAAPPRHVESPKQETEKPAKEATATDRSSSIGPGTDEPTAGPAAGPERGIEQKKLSVRETADLIQRLEQMRPQIEARDPRLAAAIDSVSLSFWEKPLDRVDNPRFKTELAYALQDVEKLNGPIPIQQNIRDELTRLAGTSPGLQNEQLQTLLQRTPTIDNSELVARLRDKAAEVARKTDQNTKTIQNDVNALSYEVLVAPKREPAAAPPASPERAGPAAEHLPTAVAPAAKQSRDWPQPPAARSVDPEISPPTANAKVEKINDPQAQIAAFDPDPDPAPNRPTETHAPTKPAASPAQPAEAKQPVKTPAAAATAPANDDNNAQKPEPNQNAQAASMAARTTQPSRPEPTESDSEPEPTKHEIEVVQQKLIVGGLLGKTLGAAGKAASAAGRVLEGIAPHDPQPAPQQKQQQPQQELDRAEVKQSLQNFESTRMKARREEKQFTAAAKAAGVALNALKAFHETPGVDVLNRIQEAAANNKGGMQAVIEGMREGGPFEDLRKQYKAALENDHDFGAAYNRAAEALDQYGKHREAIAESLAAHPKGAQWSAYFENLDGQVGEAASNTPGQKQGKSALEHLADKAREIVDKAIEKIRSLFRHDADASSRAAPSPSPGP